MRSAIALVQCLLVCACGALQAPIGEAEKQALDAARWAPDKANAWYTRQPWPVGVNFIPSTAINQLEMWQADSFDPQTIERELGWAADLNMNLVRVYLHDLAWEQDPEGLKQRMDRFLAIAWSLGIKTSFVIFDDVWNPDPRPGPQPAPVPGVHNSGWVQSPGPAVVNDPAAWPRLQRYVTDILTHFGQDHRVLYWDLYNEPGNEGQGSDSLPLLREVFLWARSTQPSQPLTVGTWNYNRPINSFAHAASDIISFHHYGGLESLQRQVQKLQALGRPIICTEWMARTENSLFQTHLPYLKQAGVGAISWGLVAGKTQTIYPWGSPRSDQPPQLWFHDILYRDGTPYRPEEVEVIRRETADLGSYPDA